MPCAAFEDLLSGYGELTAAERHSVDVHLAICGDCREHRETLAELDRELARLYGGLQPRATFAANAISSASEFRPPRRPSAWPEVLDFCGWAAVVAIVAALAVAAAAQAGIALEFPPYTGWFAAAILAAAALAALRLRALPRD
jgi:anti-sigma factor RsiW